MIKKGSKSEENMRILLLTSEEWNDRTYGNNNMTNWFSEFEGIDIAHVYCSAGKPENRCCLKYYHFNDIEMGKSVFQFFGKAKGCKLIYENYPQGLSTIQGKTNKKVPRILKTETVRFIRDIVWKFARIDTSGLKEFISEFNPDIVFTQRKASLRILRIEREIHRLFPELPFMVYTADDEYSLKQFYISPSFWIHRFMIRSYMRKNIKFYNLYYTDAEKQAEEYEKIFSVKTAFLAKCGDFSKTKPHESTNEPLVIVYAGKLYCRRWRTLEELAKALKKVNKDTTRAVLHIYTQSPIKSRYRKYLDDKQNSFILGKVSSEELEDIYNRSDIALHIESFDIKNRLLTRYSFSTKIMDCMNTGCAVMAICHPSQNGLQYLRKQDAAIVVDDPRNLMGILNELCDNHYLIKEFAQKAIDCGKRNHQKEVVQKLLMRDMETLTTEQKGKR